MAEFVMPILGADMSDGTLVEWRKKPGETVRKGEIMAVVETDKGAIEIESFASGIVEILLVESGRNVPVKTPLAIIREEAPATAPVALPVSPSKSAQMQPVTPERPTGRARLTPLARALAEKLGIDPSTVQGTGPSGAIQREDIERAAEQRKTAAPRKVETDRFVRMRQTIAAAMSRSKREIPHYYLSTQVCMHRALSWLERENVSRTVEDRLIYGVLLLKAVALALRAYPEFNSVWEAGRVVPREQINVGVAISLRQGGLLAPALHETDRQPLGELMKRFLDLVKRTRSGGLRGSELSDPTITVTSLGEQGVENVFGVIYPPQVAIVGFGKISERPWVEGGQVVAQPVLTATLSGDHRVSDGHRGGRFLSAIERLLQEPEKL